MLKIFLYYEIFFLLFNKNINCENTQCFEYSCEECLTEEYGKCTKCRNGFRLLEGTCPCADLSCALCETGLAGLHICKLCKNGYYSNNNDCYCDIDNCEICTENTCIKCKTGYFYNSLKKECEEENDNNRINCNDVNCKSCYTEEIGGCENCKEGYDIEKGICIKMPDINENNKCPEHYYLDEDDHTCKKNCYGVDCSEKQFYYYVCPSNECLVCTNNNLQIFSECDNSEKCTKQGCLNCIDDNECVICEPGYYLLGGECKPCIDGCSYCVNSETCIYCLSGFNLNSQKKCIFKNEFDFNVNKYKKRRNDLIKQKFPGEHVNDNDLDNIEIPECDINCEKCFDNNGICKQCKNLYILEDNTCIKHCSDPNCLKCTLLNSNEQCSECKSGYYLNNGKCKYICNITNCIDCILEEDLEICKKCDTGFNLDESKNICKKLTNYISIAFAIIGILIIIICIISFCLYRKKRREYRRELMAMRYMANNQGGNVVYYRRNDNSNINELESAQRTPLSKGELADEFDMQKRKMEKGNQLCQFCKQNPGKYKSDCGCIVCKEHSNLKKVEGDGESYNVCFSCGKIVKKIIPIKLECHICMQKKINVAHFKCDCALEVCKECYIKCKMSSDKCPGCRAKI